MRASDPNRRFSDGGSPGKDGGGGPVILGGGAARITVVAGPCTS